MSVNSLLFPNNIKLNTYSLAIGAPDQVVLKSDVLAGQGYDLILPAEPSLVNGQVLSVSNAVTGQLSFSEGTVKTEVYNSIGAMPGTFVGGDKDKYFSFMVLEPVGAEPTTGTSLNPILPSGFYELDIIVNIRKISGGSNIFNFNMKIVRQDGSSYPMAGLSSPTLTSLGSGDIDQQHYLTRKIYINKNDDLDGMAIIWENTTAYSATWDSWQVPYYNIVISRREGYPDLPPA